MNKDLFKDLIKMVESLNLHDKDLFMIMNEVERIREVVNEHK